MGNGELSGGDKTWIVARGIRRPNETPSRLYLSGMKDKGRQGIELAPGIVGLDRPPTELVWLQEARQNGADLVGANIDVRTLRGAVNILGKKIDGRYTTRAVREAYSLWNRSQALDQYLRLFFMNSYSGIRFLDCLVGESPAASLEKDPAIRKGYIGYPFTWVCPNPYFKGYTEEFDDFRDVKAGSDGFSVGKLRIRTLGDAPMTYPQVWLPGPGIWRIPRGLRQDDGSLPAYDPTDPETYVELPALKAGEQAWLDPNPRVETIVNQTAAGTQTNLWAKMKGQRPKLHLPGSTSEEWTFAVKGGSGSAKPKVVVQPLYLSYN